VWGEDHLRIAAAGRSFRVHAHSFFQVNLAETENLVALLAQWIGEAGLSARAPGPLLLDLYGGVGLFAIAFAERFLRIATVEGDRNAVPDAAENVRRDEVSKTRVEVVNGFVEKVLERWAREFPFGDPKESAVLVDPPRVGLEASAAESLAALAPRNILYVSCDPSTLARDCRRLAGAGYRVRKIRPIDMFPQTAHVETVTWLGRND
jgi:23S rRNA (uracil1939-C5)-methyltransferase